MMTKVDRLIEKWGNWYQDERNSLAFDTAVLSIFGGTVLVVVWELCKELLI